MFDPIPLVSAPADRRLHIQELYKAGNLTPEVATVQLLRLDIDELARARRLKSRTETSQAAEVV